MSNDAQRITISNAEQLWLMSQVKQNLMTIDEAVSWTENRENELRSMEDDVINIKEKNLQSKKHVVSAAKKFKSFLHRKSPKPTVENKRKTSYPSESSSDTFSSTNDLKNKQIYNFSVYRFGKHKTPQKRILQIDFDGKCLSLIHHGNIVKTYAFAALLSVNGQEGKKIFIYLDDSQELEINAENLADKTKLIRLLNIINEQNEHEELGQPFDPCDKLQQSFKVIKEGFLEKKGSYTASQWHKRLVIIRSGELAYYRVEEEEPSAALNIIHLSPGSVAISAEDSNTFTVATTKESHRFRLPESSVFSQELLRDEWIAAIQEGCSRHYQEAMEAEYDDVSPNHFNKKDEEKDRFALILQELERIKQAYIVEQNEGRYVQEQMEEFIQLMKELQSAEKEKSSESSKKNNAIQNGSVINSNTTDNHSQKSDELNSLRTKSGRADVCDVSVNLESVYDVPTARVDYATLEENAYEVAEESTAFMNAVRKTSRIQTNYDSSDDEKVTSFFWSSMPPSPEKNSNTNITTDEDIDFSSLPPPPPSLCNGDPLHEINGIETAPNDDEALVYSVIPSNSTISNHVNNVSELETTKVANGSLPVDHNKNKLIGNASLSSPPPISPKPKYKPNQPGSAPGSEDYFLTPLGSSNVESVSPIPIVTSSPPAENSLTGSIPPPPPLLIVPPPPAGVPPPPPEVNSPPGSSPYKAIKSKSKVKLRPFHWVPVPKQMIGKSMWKTVPDLSGSVNVEELQELFKSVDKKHDKNQTSEDKASPPGRLEAPKKKQYESYLDRKTAQNLGIFLAGFKLRGDDLMKKLAIVNESSGGISTEYIVGLQKYAPEPELKSLYAKHAGRENEELAKEDRFLAELCRIPRLGLRLETLQIVRELPIEVESLRPEVDLVLSACYELLNSKKFESFLYFMLTLANSINVTNSKGTTKGIRLSTLQKISTMRTNDRKLTLLDVVVRIIKQTQPSTLELQEELASVAKSQTYSIKGLLAEIDIMRKNCFKTKKNCELMRRKKNQPSKEDLAFCIDIENELSKVELMIGKMSEKCVEIRQTLSKVLVKFGESPDTDSQELFGWVRDFLEEFRKCNS